MLINLFRNEDLPSFQTIWASILVSATSMTTNWLTCMCRYELLEQQINDPKKDSSRSKSHKHSSRDRHASKDGDRGKDKDRDKDRHKSRSRRDSSRERRRRSRSRSKERRGGHSSDRRGRDDRVREERRRPVSPIPPPRRAPSTKGLRSHVVMPDVCSMKALSSRRSPSLNRLP